MEFQPRLRSVHIRHLHIQNDERRKRSSSDAAQPCTSCLPRAVNDWRQTEILNDAAPVLAHLLIILNDPYNRLTIGLIDLPLLSVMGMSNN
ncbi:hypothetical protein D3C79_954350 [compost metagenome]